MLLVLLGCQTDDPNINKLYPDASLVPEVLSYGEVVKDYSATLPVQLTNTGQAVLTIDDIRLEGDNSSVFSIGEWPATLEIDQTAEIDITFTPSNYLTYTSTLTVLSDADDHPEEIITLTGTGREAPTPDIELTPMTLDFGTIGVSTATNYFNLSNKGDGSLHVSNMVQAGSGAFLVLGDTDFTVEPGDSTNIVVQYSPTNEEGDNGSVTISSDDPDEAEAVLLLLGNGGGDFEYPVAVIDGPTEVEPRDDAFYRGNNSTAPEGRTLVEYRWSLVPPEGSEATLSPWEITDSFVFTDIAGEYKVSLVVVDNFGVESAPATITTDAIPQELLHVELFWDTGSADLDLHLLNSEAILFTLPDDCNYCNESPDWGVSGESSDNPTLDIDDRYGYGPENINIDFPEVNNYYIRVHYFIDNGDTQVVATVKIYLYGEEVESFSKVFPEDGDAWDVAQIHWGEDESSTYVIEENSDLYYPDHRGCFTPEE